jgi:hypothetical protein
MRSPTQGTRRACPGSRIELLVIGFLLSFSPGQITSIDSGCSFYLHQCFNDFLPVAEDRAVGIRIGPGETGAPRI